MLATSCPSCASPLTFSSGAAMTAVCPACGTCVVREGDVLRDFGKIARFQRELSPIQVGARGVHNKESFRVAGVLRKGRERVRWNEWFVVFEDGETAWLGEGNGQWFFYGAHFELPPGSVGATGAGRELVYAGVSYTILEDDKAEVLAADGELPFAVRPGQASRYFDMRVSSGAGVATVDFADGTPTLWVGQDVTLVDLKLEGLRPFSGWSDPVLVQFEGPEITAVRALACNACGASVPVRAPGQSQRLACSYCGSLLALTDEGGPIEAQLLQRSPKGRFQPALALGSRGTFDGVAHEVIGAMVRSVTEDNMDWSWVEYLLYNPYRGFLWLICDPARHWTLAAPITGEVPRGNARTRVWDRTEWSRFQGGVATVRQVLGEFTWEVAVGDRADTIDYIAPPRMLSVEQAGNEVTWTVGRWLPVAEVEKAFSVRLDAATGVAPHQPNPLDTPAAKASATTRGLLLFAIAVILSVLAFVLPAQEPLLSHEYLVMEAENAWVTDTFTLAEDSVVEVQVRSAITGDPDVMISFVNAETGAAWTWTTYDTSSTRASLGNGSWVGRVEVPAGQTAGVGTLNVSAVRDPGYATPALLLLLWAALAPVVFGFERGRFETRRWENGGS